MAKSAGLIFFFLEVGFGVLGVPEGFFDFGEDALVESAIGIKEFAGDGHHAEGTFQFVQSRFFFADDEFGELVLSGAGVFSAYKERRVGGRR